MATGGWLRKSAEFDADVHVLYFGEPEEWLEQCLTSLMPEPVNILLAPGGHHNIGAARARAFARCDAPLVGFVDPDDWVLPGAFASSIAAYEDPTVACTYTHYYYCVPERPPILVRRFPCDRARLCEDVWSIMHLHLYRRSAIAPHLSDLATWPIYEEAALAAYAMLSGTARLIDEARYMKRQGANQKEMQAMVDIFSDEWAKTRLRIALDVPKPQPTVLANPEPPRWVKKANKKIRSFGR